MSRSTRMAATRTKGAAERRRPGASVRPLSTERSARDRDVWYMRCRRGPGQALRERQDGAALAWARFRESGRQLPAAMASTFFITTAIVSWSCALAVNSIVSVPGSADGVWPGGA